MEGVSKSDFEEKPVVIGTPTPQKPSGAAKTSSAVNEWNDVIKSVSELFTTMYGMWKEQKGNIQGLRGQQQQPAPAKLQNSPENVPPAVQPQAPAPPVDVIQKAKEVIGMEEEKIREAVDKYLPKVDNPIVRGMLKAKNGEEILDWAIEHKELIIQHVANALK